MRQPRALARRVLPDIAAACSRLQEDSRLGGCREPRNCQMPSVSDWKVPTSAQPKLEDYSYDLERALTSVVGLRATIPSDAYTAETLGTERAGNGVFIRNGLVLTIGYLITEAE